MGHVMFTYDYLHSTDAGAMHLAHTEDESIRHREK